MKQRLNMRWAVYLLVIMCAATGILETVSARHQQNGCGTSNDGQRIAADLLGLNLYFEGLCNWHDNCYGHGAITYGETRDSCDDKFCNAIVDRCWRWVSACVVYIPFVGCIQEANTKAWDPVCVGLAETACGLVQGNGFDAWNKHESCDDYENRGGKWACLQDNRTVYVDCAFTGFPQRGTSVCPFSTVAAGVQTVSTGGEVLMTGAYCHEILNIDHAVTLKTLNAEIVMIGE